MLYGSIRLCQKSRQIRMHSSLQGRLPNLHGEMTPKAETCNGKDDDPSPYSLGLYNVKMGDIVYITKNLTILS